MLVTALLGACNVTDEPTSALSTRRISSSSTQSSVQENDDRPSEAHLRQLGAIIPGFAGLSVAEDGVVEILLTDTTLSRRANAAVRARIKRSIRTRLGPRSLQTRVRKVDLSFAELSAWRSDVAPWFYDAPWWSSLGIDERSNRIEIGIIDDEHTSAAIALMDAVGAPPNAYRIKIRSRVRPNSSLRLRMRPLRGGLAIGPFPSP